MTLIFLRRAFVAAGALTMGASLAMAQQGRVVDPRTVPELKAEFDRAEKLGLPLDALDTKAREGFMKAASTKSVRDAVRDYADRMIKAREALKPTRGTAEIAAGADALQNDVPERVLRNLRQAQKNRSLEVPLGLLTELVVQGVPLQKATAQVESMVKAGIAESRMITVVAEVQRDVAQGVAPTTALDLRSKGVLSLPQAPAAGVAAPAIKPPLP